MESRAARKIRPSLKVEPLEDRRLLSQFGAAPAWDSSGSARPIDTQAETGPMFAGFAGPGSQSPAEPGFGPSQSGLSDSPASISRDVASEPKDSPVAGCSTSIPPVGATARASNPVESIESLVNPRNQSSTLAPESNAPAPVDPLGSDARAAASIASVPSSLPSVAPARGGSSVSLIRGPSEVVTTSARSDASASAASTPGEATLLAMAFAPSSRSEATSSPDQARAAAPLNLAATPGIVAGQVVLGQVVSPSRELSDLANPPGAPIIVEAEGSSPGSLAVDGASAALRFTPPLEIEAPQPALADVIQSFLPIDRSTMEAAIDQFLEPFDDLSSSMPELRGPMGLITASLAAAATVVSVEVAIRLRRARENEPGGDDFDSVSSFPGI